MTNVAVSLQRLENYHFVAIVEDPQKKKKKKNKGGNFKSRHFEHEWALGCMPIAFSDSEIYIYIA